MLDTFFIVQFNMRDSNNVLLCDYSTLVVALRLKAIGSSERRKNVLKNKSFYFVRKSIYINGGLFSAQH